MQAIADGKGNTQAVISGQDHAIVIVSKLAITSHRNDGACVATRQFAIMDLSDIGFTGCRVHIAEGEPSRISELNQITINR